MSIPLILTRGLGNGNFQGSIAGIITQGLTLSSVTDFETPESRTIYFSCDNLDDNQIFWTDGLTLIAGLGESLDYKLDFTALLDDESISSYSVEAENINLIYNNNTNSSVTVFVGGGTVDSTATIKTTITDTNSQARTFVKSFNIQTKTL